MKYLINFTEFIPEKSIFSKYKNGLTEKINFNSSSNKDIFFEFGEGSILNRRGAISHMRLNFDRTIHTLKYSYRHHKDMINVDGVDNTVPINRDQILDDVEFALPQIYDFMIRGRAILTQGYGMYDLEYCLGIDPKYTPFPDGVIVLVKNIATGLNTVLGLRYLDSSENSGYVILTGITVIWKGDFVNYCKRKDNIIEIYNDNINKYYSKYPKNK